MTHRIQHHSVLRRRIVRTLLVAVCLAIVLGVASTASACPSCKQALGGDPAQGDVARGMYYSILFMLSMPFAIVGSFGCMAYRAVKREQRRLAELEQARADETDDHDQAF